MICAVYKYEVYRFCVEEKKTADTTLFVHFNHLYIGISGEPCIIWFVRLPRGSIDELVRKVVLVFT